MPFPGYDDVVLFHEDLRRLVNAPSSNLDWKYALSKVSGVYLIQDTETGYLYVGSAYGNLGIWGRWSTYADNHHGDNVQLSNLCELHPERHHKFQYSILKTLPLSADKDQVIACEAVWKRKLGSRAFGLNSN